MELINREIAEYTESFTSEESKILKELVRASESELEYTDMLSGPQVGMLLKMLVQMFGSKTNSGNRNLYRLFSNLDGGCSSRRRQIDHYRNE